MMREYPSEYDFDGEPSPMVPPRGWSDERAPITSADIVFCERIYEASRRNRLGIARRSPTPTRT